MYTGWAAVAIRTSCGTAPAGAAAASPATVARRRQAYALQPQPRHSRYIRIVTRGDAFIVDAVRWPIGRRNGPRTTRGDELGGQVLNALAARNELDPAEVEDVQLGCVTQIGEQGWNIGRMVPMVAGWRDGVRTTVDRQCGSSMQTNFNAAAAIWAGQLDVVVSAGVEMMSRVPMGSNGGDLSDELLERWEIVRRGSPPRRSRRSGTSRASHSTPTRSNRTGARSRRSTRAASRTRSCRSRYGRRRRRALRR